jgi:hypothetical protein
MVVLRIAVWQLESGIGIRTGCDATPSGHVSQPELQALPNSFCSAPGGGGFLFSARMGN